MKPSGLTCYAVAKALCIHPITVSLLVRRKRNVSAEMALRLSRFTGTTAQFWMNLQSRCDLEMAEDKVADKIAQVHPFRLKLA